ncbi:PAS domain-containing protein [Coleofasciculus sp.]|uniref:PAS domain-containing protein n=1 Tax=Coleofasciculus sp. TaxID=3100458 RepID=UPI00406409FD
MPFPEEALHQRQQRLDIATTAAQLGVFEWDIQTDYAIWENPQTYQIFGHTLEDETLGKAEFMESVIHPEDRETFEWALAEGIKSNNLFHLICRIRRRNDGQWRWIELSGQLDVALDGTPLRLVGVVSDISDRKQAETALKESEDRLRLAIESAQLGTWDWNLTTNQLTWDAGCKAMFGLPPEAKISIETFFEGLHPDDRQRVEQVIQGSVNPANGGDYDVEYRTIGIQDGIERWIKAKGSRRHDHGRQSR